MTIRHRLAKLEADRGSALVLFMADPFSAEKKEPNFRSAHVDGHVIDRPEGESGARFIERANRQHRRFAILETDSKMLGGEQKRSTEAPPNCQQTTSAHLGNSVK